MAFADLPIKPYLPKEEEWSRESAVRRPEIIPSNQDIDNAGAWRSARRSCTSECSVLTRVCNAICAL